MTITKMLEVLQQDAKLAIKSAFQNISLKEEIADFELNDDNANFIESLEDIAKNGNRKDPLTKKAKKHKAIEEVIEHKQKAETVRDCALVIKVALENQKNESKNFVEIDKALNIIAEIEKEYAKVATKAYSDYEKLGIAGIETSVKIQQNAIERESETNVSNTIAPNILKEYTRLVENALKAEQGLLKNVALENIDELWKSANDFALRNKIPERDKEIIIRQIDDEVKIQKEAFEKQQIAQDRQAEDEKRAKEAKEDAEKAEEERKARAAASRAEDAKKDQERAEIEQIEEANRQAQAAEIDQIAVNNMITNLEMIVRREGLGVEKDEVDKLAQLYVEFQKPGNKNSGILFDVFYAKANNGQFMSRELSELLQKFENPAMQMEDDGMGEM